MILKGKLHASQLYIPRDILAKLALGRESEVFLEFDENVKRRLTSFEFEFDG
jgi:hypothetical protein